MRHDNLKKKSLFKLKNSAESHFSVRMKLVDVHNREKIDTTDFCGVVASIGGWVNKYTTAILYVLRPRDPRNPLLIYLSLHTPGILQTVPRLVNNSRTVRRWISDISVIVCEKHVNVHAYNAQACVSSCICQRYVDRKSIRP